MKCSKQLHPTMTAGILMNTVYLLLHYLELPLFQSGLPSFLLGFWEGVALGLMLLGLILCKPERAEALCAWKKARFPNLFR